MADEIYWPPFRYDTILHPATASISSELPGPDKTRLRGDLLTNLPKPRESIVAGLIPADPMVRSGAGGTSKTTLNQWEHLHIVLGLPLYGLKVTKPGAVLTITKEDERSDFDYRYGRMLQTMRRNLTDIQIKEFLNNTHVMDLSGTDERLIKNEGGNLLMTDLPEKIVKRYRRVGIVVVEFDPMVFFGAGERHVNDSEAANMQAARYICKELECGVRFTHHVSKAAFREGVIDQYAGRGGSAGADNARAVHLLVRHSHGASKTSRDPLMAPPSIPNLAIEQGNVLRLHIEKMSNAPRIQEPIWLERRGFTFVHHASPSPLARRQALEEALKLQEQQDAAKVVAFIGTELQSGIKHSTRSLVSRCSAIGITKSRVQRAIEVAEASRLISPTNLPTHERRGTKSYFFDLPSAAAATTEPQKPAPRARRSRSAVTKK